MNISFSDKHKNKKSIKKKSLKRTKPYAFLCICYIHIIIDFNNCIVVELHEDLAFGINIYMEIK